MEHGGQTNRCDRFLVNDEGLSSWGGLRLDTGGGWDKMDHFDKDI